ncbi:hypothetical protein ACBY01_04490 [Sphingomonas sp. ac-8]|uniref:hypothetical protein n=1 Tax=Sphingomonas sp. ac-8 TaxID=3242977 RepID=UPI003A80AFEE
MFARARAITDPTGIRLNVVVEAQADGPTLVLERPNVRGRPRAVLDAYGAELLWGFIMSARIAGDQPLPDECTDGACTTRLRLAAYPEPAIFLIQAGLDRPLEIPASLWDRLYAELCLILAHLRAFRRQRELELP